MTVFVFGLNTMKAAEQAQRYRKNAGQLRRYRFEENRAEAVYRADLYGTARN